MQQPELETSLTGYGAELEARFRERSSQLLERSRRLTEHQQTALENASQILARNVAERLETTAEYLDRSAMGLTEGRPAEFRPVLRH